jgi:hypothetical protein
MVSALNLVQCGGPNDSNPGLKPVYILQIFPNMPKNHNPEREGITEAAPGSLWYRIKQKITLKHLPTPRYAVWNMIQIQVSSQSECTYPRGRLVRGPHAAKPETAKKNNR